MENIMNKIQSEEITVEEVLNHFSPETKKAKYQRLLRFIQDNKVFGQNINYSQAKQLKLIKGTNGELQICNSNSCIALGDMQEFKKILSF